MAEVEFHPGDYVKIRLALKEIEGHVLESSDSSVILLKLNSGYNIGIPRENVLGGKVVKRYKGESGDKGAHPLTPSGKSKESIGKSKRNIGLIVTGGTIASKLDPRTGGVKHLVDVEEFRKFYPEIFETANVSEIKVPFMVASENMNWEHWVKIAEEVEKMVDKLIFKEL